MASAEKSSLPSLSSVPFHKVSAEAHALIVGVSCASEHYRKLFVHPQKEAKKEESKPADPVKEPESKEEKKVEKKEEKKDEKKK